jgi:hypothetical protein
MKMRIWFDQVGEYGVAVAQEKVQESRVTTPINAAIVCRLAVPCLCNDGVHAKIGSCVRKENRLAPRAAGGCAEGAIVNRMDERTFLQPEAIWGQKMPKIVEVWLLSVAEAIQMRRHIHGRAAK